MRTKLLSLFAASLLLAACETTPTTTAGSGGGGAAAAPAATAAPRTGPVPGSQQDLVVNVGDRVQKGTPLVRIFSKSPEQVTSAIRDAIQIRDAGITPELIVERFA